MINNIESTLRSLFRLQQMQDIPKCPEILIETEKSILTERLRLLDSKQIKVLVGCWPQYKKKMSENGISGKKPFILNEKVIYLLEKEGHDRGLSVGIADESVKKISEHFKSTIWVTERDTSNYRRIKPEDFDEKKHIKGKLGFKGFRHINDRKKIQ